MAEPGTGADEAALAVAARHALHDEELVAALATGSLDDGDAARAQQLVDRCAACRDLHRDLAAIGGALRASAAITATAPRDFRLTADDARRLGGRVSPRGPLARLRGSLAGFARPLGASMTAMGLVGLFVASTSLTGLAGAPSSVDSGKNLGSAGAEIEPGAAQASPPSATDRTAVLGPDSTFEEGVSGGTPAERDDTSAPDSRSWLLAGSLGLLAAGLILLGFAFRRGRMGRARS